MFAKESYATHQSLRTNRPADSKQSKEEATSRTGSANRTSGNVAAATSRDRTTNTPAATTLRGTSSKNVGLLAVRKKNGIGGVEPLRRRFTGNASSTGTTAR